MNNKYHRDSITFHAVFAGKATIPTITLWNRLEGRPRTHDFERALRAEIRDPLWLLTKQWQMGEFRGDDAGSPVVAKVHVETTRAHQVSGAANPPEAFADDVPLEAKVEQRPIPFHDRGPGRRRSTSASRWGGAG